MNVRTEAKEKEDDDLRNEGLAVNLSVDFHHKVAEGVAVRQDGSRRPHGTSAPRGGSSNSVGLPEDLLSLPLHKVLQRSLRAAAAFGSHGQQP